MKHFYTAYDIKEILGLNTLRTAYLRIQQLNRELKAMGYRTEVGKVPVKYFHEVYPYIERVAK